VNQKLRDSINVLMQQNEYASALDVIRKAELSGEPTSELLVWEARLLQLGDEGTPEEVEEILRRAIKLEPGFVEAHVELGWFLLNVQDSASLAQDAFRQALKLQVETNSEIVLGLLKCSQEISPDRVGSGLRDELIQSLVDSKSIKEGLED